MSLDIQSIPAEQRRIFSIALVLNLAMFVIGLTAGLFGQSSGLVADSLDMLADASGYAIALAAINRSAAVKINVALYNGVALLILGSGVAFEVLRKALFGSAPDGAVMIGVATLALLVNTGVLHLLNRLQSSEIHIQAARADTRVDVIANLGVIVAGVVVFATAFRYVDLIVGAAIAFYVIVEALELIEQAREAKSAAD